MKLPYVSPGLERVLPFLAGSPAAKEKQKKRLAGAIKIISYLLIFSPAAFGFLYVYLFGVDVIVRDQWTEATLFLPELFSGRYSLAEQAFALFRLHNEHRIFFPRIAMLLLGNLTGYSNVAEMYLIQGCFLVTLTSLLLVFRDNIRSRLSLLVLVSFIPVSFLVFSLRQHTNMLWGFQITFAFAQVFSVLALCLLYASSREGGSTKFKKGLAFPAALGSGVVAAFSAAQGLLVWPAGLLLLLLGPIEKPAKRWMVGAWSLVGVGAWGLYFVGFNTKRSPPLLYFLEHLAVGAKYFLALLGNSFFRQPPYEVISGLVLVGLIASGLILIHKNGKWGENSFWVALLLFSFLTMAAMTWGVVGKAGSLSETPGVAPRYTTFSLLAVVSAYAMLAKLAFERKTRTTIVLFSGLCLLILASVPATYMSGIAGGKRIEAENREAAFVLATYETQPDERLEILWKRPEAIRTYGAPILERRGYNVFSESRPVLPPPLSELSPLPSSTLSEVESISGVEVDQEENQPIVIPAEEQSSIEVSGWAVDAEAEDVAGGVYLDVDGELFPAFYGVDRREVARRLGAPRLYRYSGFERTIPVSEIGTGTHELSVVILTNDEEGYYRPDRKVSFEIR